MNYLKQVNTFFELLIANPLSANAQCLYFNLLNINNRCNWSEEFTTANSTLMGFTNLNKQALYRARNELIQKKLIDFKKGINQNQSGKYKIFEFVTADDTAHDTPNNTPNNTADDTNNKLNKTKLNKTSSSSIKFYIENINPLISPFEVELLNSYCDDLSDEIVIYAIQEAIEHNAKNMKYIKKILDRYVVQGLYSIEQIKAQNNSNKKQETLEEETERLRKEWGLSDED